MRRRFESRKRNTKWVSGKTDFADMMPTVVPNNLTSNQLETYMIYMRLEEIKYLMNQKTVPPVVADELLKADNVQNLQGNKENILWDKYKINLEKERNYLIEEAVKHHPDFKQHEAGKRHRTTDRVYIPSDEFPEVNFIGLLIGPRGTTLKEMEAETNTKISIRGRGAHKDKRLDEDEELNAFIQGDSEDSVAAAVRIITRIIETSAATHGDNELKRQQLRKLAELNGVLKDDEGAICMNCGQPGHRKFDCPEKQNVTTSLVCRVCGSVGHVSKDCIHKNDPAYIQKNQMIDQEFKDFMAELGPAEGQQQPTADPFAQGPLLYPWQNRQEQSMQQFGSNQWSYDQLYYQPQTQQ